MLSTIILAGPTVLSAVGACPPHDGVRRRWRINVASAVAFSDVRKKIGRSHHRHRPGRDVFLFPPSGRNARSRYARYAATSLYEHSAHNCQLACPRLCRRSIGWPRLPRMRTSRALRGSRTLLPSGRSRLLSRLRPTPSNAPCSRLHCLLSPRLFAWSRGAWGSGIRPFTLRSTLVEIVFAPQDAPQEPRGIHPSLHGGLRWWYQRRGRRTKFSRNYREFSLLSAPPLGSASKVTSSRNS